MSFSKIFGRSFRILSAGGIALSLPIFVYHKHNKKQFDLQESQKKQLAQERLVQAEAEQVFRKTDVGKHRTLKTGVWVMYGDGVYDLTEFLKIHPGGTDKLMMAAGGNIEPFWQMYPFHKEDTTIALLAKYRIGKLHEDD